MSVYIFFLQLHFLGKRKNNALKTFCILKMKAHFETEPDFEDESSFQTHFENENMFSEK